MGWIKGFLWLLCLMPGCTQLHAQQQRPDEYTVIDAEIRLNQFVDELRQLSGNIADGKENELRKAEQELKSIDVRWNVYNQIQMGAIDDSDSIPKIMAEYELLRQTVSDSINGRRQKLEMMANFSRAERFVGSQDSVYQKLYSTVMQMSLAQALAPQLEEKKGKEALLFSEVSDNYARAVAAAAAVPSLKPRMDKVEEKYIALKILSQKIQAAEYKPWFQRIKDYLLGLAAVAIVLMFLSMIQSKIKAVKEVRKNAKKYWDLLNKDDDYPCI
jgi:hypothetical protein